MTSTFNRVPVALRIAKPVALVVLSVALGTSAARACGDSEAGLACDDGGRGPELGARYMLGRVTKAVIADQAHALEAFSKGTDGFRTADTYVFCVGPDGMMTAHPSPILRGHDVHNLHDRTGNHFIKTMIETAKPGEVSTIHYLFPKPGSTVEEPKTTYYTKSGDQVCAVGVYDTDLQAPDRADPDARLASLRRKLDGEIPAEARADWTAFLEALNAQNSAQTSKLTRAREALGAAEAALSAGDVSTTGSR